ncbi:hypothetical protein Tco_0561704 [Tanacetum coccineum]
MGSWFSCILPKNKGPYHTDLPTPEEIHQFLQFQRVDLNRTIKSKNVILSPNQVLTKELRQDLKIWEELIRENVIESAQASPKAHLPYDDDEDDGASRASTPSPTTYLNSLEPLDYQQYDIPTSSEKNDNLLFERQTDLLNQTQQMHKELGGGFKSFGKALRGVFGKKKK